ncbi:hypothetical protein HDU97_002713, partial [Phlyctochytrium planicorne]
NTDPTGNDQRVQTDCDAYYKSLETNQPPPSISEPPAASSSTSTVEGTTTTTTTWTTSIIPNPTNLSSTNLTGPFSTTDTTANPASATSVADPSSPGLSTALIAGTVGGILVGIAATILAILFIRRRKQNKFDFTATGSQSGLIEGGDDVYSLKSIHQHGGPMSVQNGQQGLSEQKWKDGSSYGGSQEGSIVAFPVDGGNFTSKSAENTNQTMFPTLEQQTQLSEQYFIHPFPDKPPQDPVAPPRRNSMSKATYTTTPMPASSSQTYTPSISEASGWTPGQVSMWLESMDVSPRLAAVLRENGVTGYQLLLLTDLKLQQMGVESGKLARAMPGTFYPQEVPAGVPAQSKPQLLNLANTCCDQIYTVCSTDGRITMLRLANIRYEGVVPDLTGLDQLTVVDLSRNNMTGPIHPSFWTLSNLEQLWLNENYKITGEISNDIGNLKKLAVFAAGKNAISGKLPESITTLSSLTFLSVPFTGLTGSIPSNLGSLTKLNFLDLSFNAFTGEIPGSFESLEVLGTLFLNGNQLTGTLPSGFGKLKALGTFEIYSNNLYGDLPSSLSGLTSLTHFTLDRNYFRGTLPDFIYTVQTRSFGQNCLTNYRNDVKVPAGHPVQTADQRSQSDCDAFYKGLETPQQTQPQQTSDGGLTTTTDRTTLSVGPATTVTTGGVVLTVRPTATVTVGGDGAVKPSTEGSATPSSSGVSGALIGGVVGAVLVAVLIAVFAVLLVRRRRRDKEGGVVFGGNGGGQDVYPLKPVGGEQVHQQQQPQYQQPQQMNATYLNSPAINNAGASYVPVKSVEAGFVPQPQGEIVAFPDAANNVTYHKAVEAGYGQQPFDTQQGMFNNLQQQPQPQHQYGIQPFPEKSPQDPIAPPRRNSISKATYTTTPMPASSSQTYTPSISEASGWTPGQVSMWLESMDVSPRLAAVLRENGVTGYQLLLLTDQRLVGMGVESSVSREIVLHVVEVLRRSGGGDVGGSSAGGGIGRSGTVAPPQYVDY